MNLCLHGELFLDCIDGGLQVRMKASVLTDVPLGWLLSDKPPQKSGTSSDGESPDSIPGLEFVLVGQIVRNILTRQENVLVTKSGNTISAPTDAVFNR